MNARLSLVASVLLVTACGGATGTVRTLASVREAAAGRPNDPVAQRDHAAFEAFSNGGDSTSVRAAAERAIALDGEHPLPHFVRALDSALHGGVEESVSGFASALDRARVSRDPLAASIAEVSASSLIDAAMWSRDYDRSARPALERAFADPGTGGVPLQFTVGSALVDRAVRRGDLDRVRSIAQTLGCASRARVAGPIGPFELLGFDTESVPPATLPAEVDLGPGRGLDPTRTVETYGCALHLGGGRFANGGVFLVEPELEVPSSGRALVRVETPNPVEIWVGSTLVARLDARVDRVARVTYHTVNGAPGDRIRLRLASRHPNPAVSVSVRPQTDAYGLEIPPASDALSTYLAAVVAAARGDIALARDVIAPLVARDDFTTSVTLVAAALAGQDGAITAAVRRDQMRRYLEVAVRRDPAAWFPVLGRARLAAADGQVPEAIAQLREAGTRWPAVGAIHVALAELAMAKGWDADALAAARRARELTTESCGPIAIELDIMRSRDRIAEIDRLIDESIRCDARSNVRLDSLVQAERWEEARAELARLARFETASSQARVEWASLPILRGMGNTAEVQAALDRLARLEPRSEMIARARADLAFAHAGDAQGRAVLEEAVTREPSAMGELHRTLRAVGGIDLLAGTRRDGLAIVEAFRQSGRRYSEPQALVYDYAVIRVLPDGSRLELVHQIYLLQTDEAVDEHGEFTPPAGTQMLTLRTIKANANGRLEVLEPEPIAGKASISLPSLAVGDYVESEYVRFVGLAPAFPTGFIGDRFYFQSYEVPFDWSELLVIAPASMDLIVEPRGPAPAVVEETHGNLRSRRWTVRESRAVSPEPGGAAPREFLASVNYGVNANWELYVDAMRDTLADRAIRTTLAGEIVRTVLAGQSEASVETRARLLYEWVTANITDTNDFFGSAPEMLAGRTGHRGRVFSYLLSAAGIRSDIVAARSRGADPQVTRLPDVETYTSALVRIPRATEPALWISTSERTAPFAYLPPLVRGTDALVFNAAHDRVETPDFPLTTELHDVTVDIHIESDDSARVTVEEQYNGATALAWRAQLERTPRAELESRFSAGYVTQVLQGGELTSLDIVNPTDSSRPLMFRYSATVPRITRAGEDGARVFSGLFQNGYAAVFAQLPTRTTALLVQSPVSSRVVLRIHGLRAASPPATVRFDGPNGAHFESSATPTNNMLILERHIGIPVGRVEPADYAAFAEFCRRADAVESEEIVLSHP